MIVIDSGPLVAIAVSGVRRGRVDGAATDREARGKRGSCGRSAFALADLHLGTVDASVIALAERLGVTTIATLDWRHFTVVRPRHVEAFRLLPD